MSAEVLTISSATLSATISPAGASLISLSAPDRSGQLGPVAEAGAIVGRYANRIGGAAFVLDGRRYELDANEGENTLHGGAGSLGRRTWQVAAATASAVTLRVVSPAGDQGFPGELAVTATYELVEEALHIKIDAATDAPTVVSFTNHAYWNLGGPIADHRLSVASRRRVEVDAALIPTGRLLGCSGSLPLTESFDDCFVLESESAAALSDPHSGRTMAVTTNQPGVQVYTARGRVCLECQQLPDAPNQPGFPSTVLRPGEVYRHRTVHTFGIDDPSLAD